MSVPASRVEVPGPLGRRPRRVRSALRRLLGPLAVVLAEGGARLFDVVLSVVLLIVLSPLLAVLGAASLARSGRLLAREPRVGRFRTPIELLSFPSGPFRSLPRLLNVLRGEMAFAGPRALTADEAEEVPVEASVRFEVRPGLISPFGLRSRTGVAYESETSLDREFVYAETLKGDVGLLARSVPGLVLGGGGGGRPAPPELHLLGVTVVNTTMDEAVEWILDRAKATGPSQVCFVNPDCLNVAHGNPAYRGVLGAAERVLPDGIGIHLACRMLGTSLRANVNGTDLFPKLCEKAASAGVPIFLLGARPGVAAAAAEAMTARFPGLRFAGTRDGYWAKEEEEAVLAGVNASGAGVLLVAMGAPRQDLWIAERRSALTVPVRIGVGGLFDFYSGRIPRAPQWMRDIGMEWTWRLLQEPGRMWRRYVIGNPLFLWRVLRQTRRGE